MPYFLHGSRHHCHHSSGFADTLVGKCPQPKRNRTNLFFTVILTFISSVVGGVWGYRAPDSYSFSPVFRPYPTQDRSDSFSRAAACPQPGAALGGSLLVETTGFEDWYSSFGRDIDSLTTLAASLFQHVDVEIAQVGFRPTELTGKDF